MRGTAVAVLAFLVGTLVNPSAVSSRTWYVTCAGSGDAPNIQAGLDSSSAGDTVLVGCGNYYESGLHNLRPGVVLVSETGESDCVTIDAQREWSVFVCSWCDSTTIIEGFTITGGQTSEWEGPPGAGGGMKCHSSVRVVNCLFRGNNSYGYGGAVFVDGGRPLFENCAFVDNTADQGGAIWVGFMGSCIITNCTFVGNYSSSSGTVYCNQSSPPIKGSTFYGNAVGGGGSGISCFSFSAPKISNTIISSGTSGRAVDCDQWSHPTFICCDIHGNVDGDWDGCIGNQNGVNGNFSAEPAFCDAPGGNLTVESCSPCLPGNHPDGYPCIETIGAYGAGCECGAADQPATWGSIKAIYK